MSDTDEFMGGGFKTFPFDEIGDTVKGIVLEPPVKEQQRDMESGDPSFWDEEKTKPKWMFRLQLQTDLRDADDDTDDGVRTLYLSWKRLDAVRAAVRAAKAKTIEVGGTLALRFTEFGVAPKKGFSRPKIGWAAKYWAPVATADDDFIDAVVVETAPPAKAAQSQIAVQSSLEQLRAQREAEKAALAEVATAAGRPVPDDDFETVVSEPAHHSTEDIPF